MKDSWRMRMLSAVLLPILLLAGTIAPFAPPQIQVQSSSAHAVGSEHADHLIPHVFASGSGTAEDPYLVATAEDLDNVRYHLDSHFLQVSDIDLGVAPWNVGLGWIIIGDFYDRFTGSFDGGGYMIQNLTIKRDDAPDTRPTGHIAQGLFGYVEEATLRNIVLSDVDVEVSFGAGSDYIGGLVGYAYQSAIDNVHVSGEVRGYDHYDASSIRANKPIGGVAGLLYHSLLHHASSAVLVQAPSSKPTGGLVGRNGSSEIRHSYSTGTVEGVDQVGGLVGHNAYQTSRISDSYSRASVSGTDQVGGLVGWSELNSSIYRSYSTGFVTGTGTEVGGFLGSDSNSTGVFLECYWDTRTSGLQTSAGGAGVVGKPTDQMQQEETYRFYNFNTLWQVDEGSDYPLFQNLSGHNPPRPVILADLEGTGTEDDPYVIADADELNAMRQDLTASYRLGNDIDLSASVVWNYGRGWEPIGKSSTEDRFSGSLDCRGYAILNLTINRPGQTASEYYQGLLGYTQNASFSDLRLTNVNVHCGYQCGALAGRGDGFIEGISVTGDVVSESSYVGGLFGTFNNGNMLRVFAGVNVRAASSTGGIVGRNFSGDMHLTYSLGTAQGTGRVGGLVGHLVYSHTISDSHSGALVAGTHDVGGLVGYQQRGSILRSYSSGQVIQIDDNVGGLVVGRTGLVTTPSDDVGGLVGRGDGDVSDSYWDTETSGQPESAGGEGRVTSQMAHPYAVDTYVGWDFEGTWAEDAYYVHNNGYPYLRALVPGPLTNITYLPLVLANR